MDDARDLLRALAFAENHFGVALAQGPMVIDFGKIQILERKMLQAFERARRGQFTGAHRFENVLEFAFVHLVVKASPLIFATRFARADSRTWMQRSLVCEIFRARSARLVPDYGTWSPINLRSG